MRLLLQRVTRASVTIDGEVVGRIGPGLVVLVGIWHGDDDALADSMAGRIADLRIFRDDEGKTNRSLVDVEGSALVISQFTLYGDTRRGRRPSGSEAAPGPVAEPLVRLFADRLAADGLTVETGSFGAEMSVALINEGPVTLMLELDRGDATSEG